MGFLDDIIAQQSGGGMVGGLPASWQYTNPESLNPIEKQMMGLVGTQNPAQAGFNPLPAPTGAFPAAGAPAISGMNSPFGALLPDAPANNNAAPSFGAGASPIFATTPGSTPGNPALPAPAPAAPPVDEGNAPASPLAIGGGYQMPRIGPTSAFTPDPAELPVNAEATAGKGFPGRAVVAPAPTAAAAPSAGDNLMTGYQNIKHGGGLIGSIVAAVTGKRNDPEGVAQQQQAQIANMTAKALVNKGVSEEVAIAAVQPGNAELLKHLLTQVYAPKTLTSLGEGYVADKEGNIKRAYTPDKDNFQVVQTGEDGMGKKTFKQQNKATGEFRDIPGTAAGSTGADALGGDMNKTGTEYLATVPQQHRGVLKGMIDGTIQPPTSFAAAKPYWQAMLAAAKQIDPTFDENNWAARRKMSTDLASSGNSSMGGILSNGESAFKHLAEYTHSVKEQGNASHNFPLGGLVAQGQNYLGNKLGGSDTHAKVKAISDNLGHYGQESTKFYAGTGGGVEERMHALKELNPMTTSGEEAAAYAEKEKSLMVDRLQEKMKQIKNVFGEEQGAREIAKHMPDIEKSIAAIDANIAVLRGQKPAAAAHGAAPTAALAPGAYTWAPGKGVSAAK